MVVKVKQHMVPIIGFVAIASVHAADAAPDQSAGSDDTLQEIVVTAQKRSETLREVPQSISVMSGATLEAQHVANYADLAAATPGLSYSNFGGPGLSNLEIRGVSSTSGASTVSIYLDDAPITIRNDAFYSGQPEPLFFDLARSEVLRGPQGTLWGASSMGGTIRLVSNPVDLEQYGGSAAADLSGTEHGGFNYTLRGVVNVPIVADQLGLRIGVETVENSGYVDHVTPSGAVDRSGINDNRSNVVHATLAWQPTSKLTVTPSVFYQTTHIGDLGLIDLGSADYQVSKLVPEGGTDSFASASIKVNYDLDWADATSVSSYAWRHFPRTTDGTYFNSAYMGYFMDDIIGVRGVNGKLDGSVLADLPGPVYDSLNTRQVSEELRLASKPYDPSNGLPIAWIAGLYYADASYLGTSSQYVAGFNKAFQTAYGVPPVDILGVATPNDLLFAFANHLDDRQYAAFGEFSYYPLPALKLTAGLRYLYGRDSETDTSTGFFSSQPIVSGNTKSYPVTPKFSVTYDVDSNLTTYATAAKGFRLGGINPPVPALQCANDLKAYGLTSAPDAYAPDKLWNYELGAKGRFMDDKLAVNAAVYDIEWDKIQLQVPLKTCGFDFYGNVGHAQSSGVEFDVTQRVAPGLTLGVNGQYTHDVFTQSLPGLGIAKGDLVPGAPVWSLGLTADYEHEIAADVDGFVRADWQFIGGSHGTFDRTDQDYQRPSYNLLGGSVGALVGDWEISLYVRNLLDADKIIQRPSDNSVPEGYTPVPRTVGLQANVRF